MHFFLTDFEKELRSLRFFLFHREASDYENERTCNQSGISILHIPNVKYACTFSSLLSFRFQKKRSKIAVNAELYNCHGNIFPDLVVITFIAVETKVLSGARNCAVHYSLDSGGDGGGGGFSIYLRAKRTARRSSGQIYGQTSNLRLRSNAHSY